MNQNIKTVKQIRSELKNIMHDEIQNLPDTLKALKPRERLDILIRLMPFALPKSGKINATYGEPFSTEW